MVARYATVPTKDRHSDLADCLKALDPQVDLSIVVDTGSTPPVKAEDYGPRVRVLYTDPAEPPNISRWWNCGYSLAASYAAAAGATEWSVATVNDDAIVPVGWFEAIDSEMRLQGGAAGCSGAVSETLVHWTAGPVYLQVRMAGWAFVLRGETGLRADESLQWWYGDDDLAWRAAKAGGVVIVPGHPVEHRHPNESTVGALAEQAGRDRATFIAKWQQAPW